MCDGKQERVAARNTTVAGESPAVAVSSFLGALNLLV